MCSVNHVCVCVSCSVVSNSVNPWTAAHQAPLSIGFSRQEHWSGLPFPSPGDLPNLKGRMNQGSNPGLLHCRQIIYYLSCQGSPSAICKCPPSPKGFPGLSDYSSSPKRIPSLFSVEDCDSFEDHWALFSSWYIQAHFNTQCVHAQDSGISPWDGNQASDLGSANDCVIDVGAQVLFYTERQDQSGTARTLGMESLKYNGL